MKPRVIRRRSELVDISVVTPTYNRAPLLLRVWNSLNKQRVNFEWIVVDDGSVDNTKEVIEGIKDAHIQYVQFAENRGVNAARNAGVNIATGRYIVFLDSDDELYPNSLQIMVAILDRTDYRIGAVAFATVIADTGKQVSQLKDGVILNEYDIVCRGALLDGDKIYVYRHEVFKDFHLPEDLRGCEHVFLYGISKKWNFLMINEPLTVIHRQQDNLSSAANLVRRSYDIARSYERVIENHKDILKNEHEVRSWYLKKAIYRYGVAGSRKDVWRLYKSITKHSKKISDYFEGTGLLIIGLVGGLESIEVLRVNRMNTKLLKRV